MTGIYSTYSISSVAEDFEERASAIAAEKAVFGDSVLEKVYYGKNFGSPESDIFICRDGCDDGKISFGEKLKNFGKGLVSPIKNIFASPKNMAVAGLTVAAGAALIALTGGAAAPVMVALGLVGGATQVGVGLYKQATATTDAQAAQAWQQMGSGTFAVGASALGAKSALKTAGVKNASNMSTWGAIVKCLKDAPAYFSKSMTMLSAKFPTIFPNCGGSSSGSSVIDVDFVDVEPVKPRARGVKNPDVIELSGSERIGLPAPKTETGNVNPNPKPRVAHKPTIPDVIHLPESQRLGLPSPQIETGSGSSNIVSTSSKTPEVIQLQPSKERLALPSGEKLALSAPKIHNEINTSTVIELPAEMPHSSSNPKLGFKGNFTEKISGKMDSFKSFLGLIWQKIQDSMDLFGINNDK